MAEKAPPVTQAALLEQFLILAKSAKGASAVELINQVLEAPNVYVFGELLDMPNIQELSDGPFAPYFNLLLLFSFGTYSKYLENHSQYPPLTQTMIAKLRHLTIVSLATKDKCLPYSKLLVELDLKNLRELEDVIIEGIYADVVRGKLDQKNNRLEVEYTIGRDIKPEDVDTIITGLQEWCDICENTLSNIEAQIVKANNVKDNQIKLKQHIEAEVASVKKNLKVHNPEIEDPMNVEMRDVSQEKPAKKQQKSKVLNTLKMKKQKMN